MIYTIGRFLQFVGLLTLPIAIAGNLANERLTLMESLKMSTVGIVIFSFGWLLQQSAKKR
ncbi:MAG TPA: hypothetical protein VE988_19110 [Gemmataceae bacterium]|nr:hypothetical protein [Gemmataceae bacterium]